MELRIALLAAAVLVAGTVIVGVLSLLFHAGSYLFRRPAEQTSRTPVLGAVGRVQVPVPKDGVGAVALLGTGTRVTVPARSGDGRPLPLGAQVVVSDATGGVAVVELFTLEE